MATTDDEKEDEDEQERTGYGSLLDVIDDLDPSVGESTDARNMDEYVYGELWDDEGNDEPR